MKHISSLLIAAALVFAPVASACKKPVTPAPPAPPAPPTPPAPEETVDPSEYWKIDNAVEIHAMDITQTEQDGIIEYSCTTTGSDPYCHLEALKDKMDPERYVLTFEYKLSSAQDLQIYYCTPGASEPKSTHINIASASAWKTFSYDMELDIVRFGWGEKGHRLRLDIGNSAGINLAIRNIYVRRATEQELAAKDESAAEILATRRRATAISNYLAATYDNSIRSVAVTADKVIVDCQVKGSGYELVEITPAADITNTRFTLRTPISASGTITLDRMSKIGGLTYDRLLSRWAIVQAKSSTEDILCSHARYADQIPCDNSMAEVKMRTKKGLGGFFGPAKQISDLDELQISSVTVNVTPNTFARLSPSGSCYQHTYCGKTYYFLKSKVDEYDNLFRQCSQRGIVVSAIILIQRTAADPQIASALVHPDCNGGNYSMPNMTSIASVNTYAAILDFLASRYSPADGSNGCIHNWILHNEVDAASTWTNMGSNLPEMIVTNEYEKSLRICYNIARKYYPHAKVLASFTHTWTACDNTDGYTAKSMLGDLVRFSAAEGDFEWGVAAHPYPQNLLEPRFWSKDTQATYSDNSGFVTFKNLEVLDKWAKTPANMYKGNVKRAVWLSENGTNSRSYSQADLADQAAGAAWAMKKVYRLDGIDGIQWHNWFDHPTEAADGLRIGLRDSDLNPKPVWTVYRDAGTANESATFDKYLSIIGISSWDEIHHKVE